MALEDRVLLGARHDQVLDMVAKRPADRRLDRVDAALVLAVLIDLDHGVASIVDHVSVVARTAVHRVGARPAIQRVVAAPAFQLVGSSIARHDVVEAVADAVDVTRAAQDQVLDIGAEPVADICMDRVSAACVRVDPFGYSSMTCRPHHRHRMCRCRHPTWVSTRAPLSMSLPVPP